jgi:MscS family membrane protein
MFSKSALISVLVSAQMLGLISVAWAQAPAESPLPEAEVLLGDIMKMDFGAMAFWRIGAAVLIMMAGILMRTTVLGKLLKPLEFLTRRTKTEVDDTFFKDVRKPLGWIFNLVAIYFALLVLKLPETVMATSVLILQTMGTVFVAWGVFVLVDAIAAYLAEMADRTDNVLDDHLVPLLKRVLRILVIGVTVITVIQQWGYDVTSLIAGLGIGGLAFALAAQSTLSNWFGSFMILTDRPFLVGDYVRSEHGEGVVKDIGMRSTKILTFEDTTITIPNSDLATTAVENLTMNKSMNVKLEIGVMYSTTRPQMESIIASLREVLSADEDVDSERILVCFSGFGDSSLNILIHCFVATSDMWKWHQIRERLMFKTMTVVEEGGASFAFPSQSVYFETPLAVSGQS